MKPFTRAPSSRFKRCVAVLLVAWLSVATSHAAANALRLGNQLNGWLDFVNNPNSFPVCKAGLTHLSGGGNQHLFDTTNHLLAVALNTSVSNTFISGADVVNSLANAESAGKVPTAFWIYREDWLNMTNGIPGGPFTNDWRILTLTEISNIRAAIAGSTLRCKNTVKMIQLLGSGAAWFETEGHAQSFPAFPPGQLDYLRTNFDGVGLECHIGDDQPASGRQEVLAAMVAIARWTTDNGKIPFVFMGGGINTYEDLAATQLTYEYLWREMLRSNVNYRATNLIYLRQGARAGKMVPESAPDTLTHQMRWLINTFAASNSLFVSEVADQSMTAGATAQIPFALGEAELPFGALTFSVTSSNETLVASTNLVSTGRGAERSLTVTPGAGQTGVTRITLSVSDGTYSVSNSFQLTVTPLNAIVAVAGGDINDPNTWASASAPVSGDTNVWRTGNFALNLSATNVATFHGDTFEVQTNGQFAPGKPTATLTLNKLILNGGTIAMANNVGLTMDLSGQQFTLKSGTIKSGNGSSMSVTLQDGNLAGSGSINITGGTASGAQVQFSSSINPLGFTGVFRVSANGILNLPPIPADNASFGISLSGTGRYANDVDVALTSLTIAGTNLLPGIYAYTNFTPAQRAFLVNTGSVITVVSVTNTPPMLTAVSNCTVLAGQTLVVTNVATDADVPAQTLTFSLLTSFAGATVTSNGVFTWRPTIAQSPSTNTIKGVVADNGSPGLSATNSFTVTVIQPAKPVISFAGFSGGQFNFTINGTNGPDYIVLASTNLTSWSPLWTNVSPVLPFNFTNVTTNFNRRFYRVLLGP